MTDKTKTSRGFRVYAERDRIRVQESSIAYEGAHVRIYGGRDPDGHVQLSVPQAEIAIGALQIFVKEARANELTEPAVREEGES